MSNIAQTPPLMNGHGVEESPHAQPFEDIGAGKEAVLRYLERRTRASRIEPQESQAMSEVKPAITAEMLTKDKEKLVGHLRQRHKLRHEWIRKDSLKAWHAQLDVFRNTWKPAIKRLKNLGVIQYESNKHPSIYGAHTEVKLVTGRYENRRLHRLEAREQPFNGPVGRSPVGSLVPSCFK